MQFRTKHTSDLRSGKPLHKGHLSNSCSAILLRWRCGSFLSRWVKMIQEISSRHQLMLLTSSLRTVPIPKPAKQLNNPLALFAPSLHLALSYSDRQATSNFECNHSKTAWNSSKTTHTRKLTADSAILFRCSTQPPKDGGGTFFPQLPNFRRVPASCWRMSNHKTQWKSRTHKN